MHASAFFADARSASDRACTSAALSSSFARRRLAISASASGVSTWTGSAAAAAAARRSSTSARCSAACRFASSMAPTRPSTCSLSVWFSSCVMSRLERASASARFASSMEATRSASCSASVLFSSSLMPSEAIASRSAVCTDCASLSSFSLAASSVAALASLARSSFCVVFASSSKVLVLTVSSCTFSVSSTFLSCTSLSSESPPAAASASFCWICWLCDASSSAALFFIETVAAVRACSSLSANIFCCAFSCFRVCSCSEDDRPSSFSFAVLASQWSTETARLERSSCISSGTASSAGAMRERSISPASFFIPSISRSICFSRSRPETSPASGAEASIPVDARRRRMRRVRCGLLLSAVAEGDEEEVPAKGSSPGVDAKEEAPAKGSSPPRAVGVPLRKPVGEGMGGSSRAVAQERPVRRLVWGVSEQPTRLLEIQRNLWDGWSFSRQLHAQKPF